MLNERAGQIERYDTFDLVDWVHIQFDVRITSREEEEVNIYNAGAAFICLSFHSTLTLTNVYMKKKIEIVHSFRTSTRKKKNKI